MYIHICPGPAASLLPLACTPQACGVAGAVACITAFMGLQAFAYAGFHAYIQVLCPAVFP